MSDTYYTSRYRITYTPEGEPPIILLDADDWCNGLLSLACNLASQVEQPIMAPWATHYSRGNAQLLLNFTHYATAATREAAQIAGIERMFYLMAHPQGEILLETAWGGPVPQISQRLNATLTHLGWKDRSGENSPAKLWLELSYSFMVSLITNN